MRRYRANVWHACNVIDKALKLIKVFTAIIVDLYLILIGLHYLYSIPEVSLTSSLLPGTVCDVSLDLVFMLDQSGSVGPDNHAIAIDFLQDVVAFFPIASNATQVSGRLG